MGFVPIFELLASDGTTPVYTFQYVVNKNDQKDNPTQIVLSNIRSSGEIIIPAGNQAWDYTLEGVLLASDYGALETAKESIVSTVLPNTRYVLRIHKTISTYTDYKVMRLSSVQWGNTNNRTYQYYTITLRVYT